MEIKMFGPLSLLRMIPTSQIGNMLNLPGEDLPFLPPRFAMNMVKQAVKPDYPDVPLLLRMMASTPPAVIAGRMVDAIGVPKTGYPVPIRMAQGALSLLRNIASR
jgi:hypothetical protein